LLVRHFDLLGGAAEPAVVRVVAILSCVPVDVFHDLRPPRGHCLDTLDKMRRKLRIAGFLHELQKLLRVAWRVLAFATPQEDARPNQVTDLIVCHQPDLFRLAYRLEFLLGPLELGLDAGMDLGIHSLGLSAVTRLERLLQESLACPVRVFPDGLGYAAIVPVRQTP